MTTTALETVKSDRKEASEFLAALFEHYLSDNDGYVEPRFKPPEKDAKPVLAFYRREVGGVRPRPGEEAGPAFAISPLDLTPRRRGARIRFHDLH
jgi:hypothetical protein